jgi:hypothetical protein
VATEYPLPPAPKNLEPNVELSLVDVPVFRRRAYVVVNMFFAIKLLKINGLLEVCHG